MKNAIAQLESVSPLSFSRHYDVPKLQREIPKDYEARTWRNRLHVNADGNVIIPPTFFKNCLSLAAKYMNVQIPGQGKATYTKHFEAGVLVIDPLVLPLKAEDTAGEWLFVPADGKRGSGKRVEKCFPIIPEWQGIVTFLILDEIITADVFNQVLDGAGRFIGLGRFRPRNNGFYGRFAVKDIGWD